MQIGEVLHTIRTSLGGEEMTQEKLADLVGVSRSMITHCETRNTVPSDKVLQNIARVFAQDSVEYEILLRRLRRGAAYSRNPEVYQDILTTIPGEENNLKDRVRLEKLPVAICEELQDLMSRLQINSKSLSSMTGLAPEIVREIVQGNKAVSMKDLEEICTSLNCNFDEIQLRLGHLPDALREALISNRALVNIFAKMISLIKNKSEADVLEFVENMAECFNSHFPN